MVVSLSWRSTSDVYHVVSTTHTPKFLSAFLMIIELSFLSERMMLWRVLLRGVVEKGTEVSLWETAERTVDR